MVPSKLKKKNAMPTTVGTRDISVMGTLDIEAAKIKDISFALDE